MRVNPNSEVPSATGVPARAPAQAPALGADLLTLGAADGLNRALEQTPVARPDQVARAKDLVQDVSYPAVEIIQKISVLLAARLDQSNQAQ